MLRHRQDRASRRACLASTR